MAEYKPFNIAEYSTLLITVGIASAFAVYFFVLSFLRKGKEDPDVNVEPEDLQPESKAEVQPVGKKKKLLAEKQRRDLKIPYSHRWLLTTLKGHSGTLLDLDFSSNGKYLASCAEDRAVFLWSTKTFSVKDHKYTRANVEFDHATRVKWSPDCKAFVISQGNGNTIQVYRVGRKDDGSLGSTELILTFPVVHKAEILNIGIACNGKFIMSCSKDTSMVIWDLKGEILATIDTHHVNNYYGCVSPCGRFVGSSGFTPDVKVWEVCFSKGGEYKEVKRAFELKGHSAGVYHFAFSSNSTRMASVSKDGSWKLWDTDIEYQKGQEPYLLKTGSFTSPSPSLLDLSPDGITVVIACGQDATIFNGITGEEQEKLTQVHTEPIIAVRFSLNNKYLLVAGGRHVRVFLNVQGYQNLIQDLENRKTKANTQSLRDRLQAQIEEAKNCLESLGKMS